VPAAASGGGIPLSDQITNPVATAPVGAVADVTAPAAAPAAPPAATGVPPPADVPSALPPTPQAAPAPAPAPAPPDVVPAPVANTVTDTVGPAAAPVQQAAAPVQQAAAPVQQAAAPVQQAAAPIQQAPPSAAKSLESAVSTTPASTDAASTADAAVHSVTTKVSDVAASAGAGRSAGSSNGISGTLDGVVSDVSGTTSAASGTVSDASAAVAQTLSGTRAAAGSTLPGDPAAAASLLAPNGSTAASSVNAVTGAAGDSATDVGIGLTPADVGDVLGAPIATGLPGTEGISVPGVAETVGPLGGSGVRAPVTDPFGFSGDVASLPQLVLDGATSPTVVVTAGLLTLAGVSAVGRGAGLAGCVSGAQLVFSNVRLIPCLAARSIGQPLSQVTSAALRLPSRAVPAPLQPPVTEAVQTPVSEAVPGGSDGVAIGDSGLPASAGAAANEEGRLVARIGAVLAMLYGAFLGAWLAATRVQWNARH
jgi:hypothetical protein